MIAKRIFDRVVGGALLILLGPVMIVVGILIRLTLGSPVLYRSQRPGLNGELFTMYKFRTMTEDRETSGVLLPDEERLTRFGRLIRSLSLDELPELWNVWRGDMSLVGPRPLLPEYLDRYDGFQARRHEVLPGMTGLAQVRGRNAISWEDRFALDVWYVDNRNLVLDLQILLETFWRVVTRSGISADGHATMPEFRGGDG